MEITVQVDDAAWAARLETLVMLEIEKGSEATLKGAEEIRDVARDELLKLEHPRDTWTPSPRGAAPASISGDLAASMTALLIDPEEAWVGPTDSARSFNGPYGRIQELGGGMHGHPLMKFYRINEGWYEREYVRLPARPYLEPATEKVVDSGRLTEIYVEYIELAIQEATG